MFKKTCFVCGEKVDKVYHSKCENCFREEHPPIVEIKPINLKYCNQCKKVYYENHLMEISKVLETLNKVIHKYVVLDKNYILKDVKVSNFEIINSKVSFEIEVDSEFKE